MKNVLALLFVLLLCIDGWNCKGAAKSAFRGAARATVHAAAHEATKPAPLSVCVDPRTDECVYITGTVCTRPLRPPTLAEFDFCRKAYSH